jgi:AAA domain
MDTRTPTPAEQAWIDKQLEIADEQEKYDELMNRVAAGRLADAYWKRELNLGRSLGDVARVMREGHKAPTMLVDEWLIAGELHWMYAEPGGAKTWFALWLAKQVIEAGDLVVWIDEEMGVDTAARRLALLGADPDLVERNFVYFPYPAWFQDKANDLARWDRFLQLVKPVGLLVVDTATDALAEAELDENKGIDVTAWVKAFCEPARRVGAAALVLDHVPKSGSSGGYAVGSRAKKAKAKVQYELDTKKPFDVYTVGLVRATRTKNGLGADIPKKRDYRIGGTVDDETEVESFTIEQDSGLAATLATDGSVELRDKIVKEIREHGPLTTSQIKQLVTGNSARISKMLAELNESALFSVKARKEGKSVVYEWVPEPEEGESIPSA